MLARRGAAAGGPRESTGFASGIDARDGRLTNHGWRVYDPRHN
jgi:hypothetical protein